MIKRIIFLGLLGLAVLISFSLSTALRAFQPAMPTPTATTTSTSTPTQYPPVLSVPSVLGEIERNVTYCTNDIPLKMDIYFPNTGKAPWPALLYIHGGGWVGGDKFNVHATEDISAFRNAGYFVAAMEYRLAPQYPFPDMIVDAKCAVRFLRAHAAEFKLDPNHIGAWGSSAGGHIVSLLGLAGESAGWDTGQYLEQSSRVQAVVDMFGPTDLADPSYVLPADKRSYILFNVAEPTKSMLEMASPITYVSPGDPPFLIIHGNKDEIVSVHQSEILFNRLIMFGIPAKLMIVLNAGHGLATVGGVINPSREQVTQSMITFFDYYLKAAP
jgi:acetyl esterase/lipase